MRRKEKRAKASEALTAWSPARERAAVLRQLERTPAGSREAAARMALACRAAALRTRAKARSDHDTDAARRVLVGARLPRTTAERVQRAAARRGVSVYAWTRWAIEQNLAQEEASILGADPDPPMEAEPASLDQPPWT